MTTIESGLGSLVLQLGRTSASKLAIPGSDLGLYHHPGCQQGSRLRDPSVRARRRRGHGPVRSDGQAGWIGEVQRKADKGPLPTHCSPGVRFEPRT